MDNTKDNVCVCVHIISHIKVMDSLKHLLGGLLHLIISPGASQSGSIPEGQNGVSKLYKN